MSVGRVCLNYRHNYFAEYIPLSAVQDMQAAAAGFKFTMERMPHGF